MAKLLHNRWIALIFISMSISLVIIDGTIVNTIFPNMIEALDLNSTEVQWVQESYVLVFASLLLVWGSVADRVGRRLLLIIGVLIFIASSVWAGTTTDAVSLIAARVLQGLGGSMVLPTTLSLLNATFQGRERGIAFAVWGATIGGMVAIGPVVGGWLATDFKDGWRLAFNVNLPIGIIIVIGLLLFAVESKARSFIAGLDVMGAVLSIGLFFNLVFSLIEGRTYGWFVPNERNPFVIGEWEWPLESVSVIPFTIALTVIFGVLFIAWEHSRAKAGKSVLLDLTLFRLVSFRNGAVAALIISMGEFGLVFAIPLWLQNVKGLSPVESGLALLWLAGGAFLASGISGGMSGKLIPAQVVRIGVLLELIGVIATALAIGTNGDWFWVAPGLLIYGVGVGFATAQLTGVTMSEVPMEQVGQASGTQSTMRQVGSALGIAVIGSTLFTGTQWALESRLTDLEVTGDNQTQIVNAVVDSAGGAIPKLTDGLVAQNVPSDLAAQVTSAAGSAFADGAMWAAFAAATFLVLGLLSSFRLGSPARKDA